MQYRFGEQALTEDEIEALVEALDDSNLECGYLPHRLSNRLPQWTYTGHSGDVFLTALARQFAELVVKVRQAACT